MSYDAAHLKVRSISTQLNLVWLDEQAVQLSNAWGMGLKRLEIWKKVRVDTDGMERETVWGNPVNSE